MSLPPHMKLRHAHLDITAASQGAMLQTECIFVPYVKFELIIGVFSRLVTSPESNSYCFLLRFYFKNCVSKANREVWTALETRHEALLPGLRKRSNTQLIFNLEQSIMNGESISNEFESARIFAVPSKFDCIVGD